LLPTTSQALIHTLNPWIVATAALPCHELAARYTTLCFLRLLCLPVSADILANLEQLPLGMQVRSAISMSGTQGKEDLRKTIEAAGIALGIVWFGLVLRYRAAGLLGFFLSLIFLWLHLCLFNASSYALSDAAIVAVVSGTGWVCA
jgi:hypothetical protein